MAKAKSEKKTTKKAAPAAPEKTRKPKVTQKDIINSVAAQVNLPKSKTKEVFDAIFDNIINATVDGNSVAISNFGIFESVDRAAKTVRNPQTNEKMEVPPSKAPKFKPSSVFKDICNNAKK